MLEFDEYDTKASDIMFLVEAYLSLMERILNIHFREPHHDIARRFLNEIREFEANTEVM